MSQFEQFALNAEAPGAALGTLAEDRGQSAASRGTNVAGEEVQVVSGKSDDGEEGDDLGGRVGRVDRGQFV